MPYIEVRLTQCWFSKTVVNAPKILSSKSDQLCWVSLLLLTRPGRPKICTIVTWMFSVHCAAQSWAHATIVSTIWQGFKANNNVVCHISAKYTVVSKLHVEQEKKEKMGKKKILKHWHVIAVAKVKNWSHTQFLYWGCFGQMDIPRMGFLQRRPSL